MTPQRKVRLFPKRETGKGFVGEASFGLGYEGYVGV